MTELLSEPAGDALPTVVDVTAATFETAVMAESMSRPVVVDLWGPSCGPCRTLGPILEKVAGELGGRVLLAKVNVEAEHELAQAFGVQSIPAVVAIDRGQPVDQFVGALPEEQVREWMTRLAPSMAETMIAEADALIESDASAAAERYREALAESPPPDAAKVGLADALTRIGQRDEALRLIEELEERGYLEPRAGSVKNVLALPAADNDDVAAARAEAEADPEDLSKKVRLAEALAGASRDGDALELALEVVQADRAGAGEEAKAVMLRVFDKLGGGSPLTGEYRRKLTTLLY